MRAGLLVGLGLATTVAVAWGCGAFVEPRRGAVVYGEIEDPTLVRASLGLGSTQTIAEWAEVRHVGVRRRGLSIKPVGPHEEMPENRWLEHNFPAIEWTPDYAITLSPGFYRLRSRKPQDPMWMVEPEWVNTAPPPGLWRWGTLPRLPRTWAAIKGLTLDAPFEAASGWPWPALWCSLAMDTGAGGTLPVRALGGVVVPGGDPVDPAGVRVLPLRPIRSGLALNTLVYAGAWGVVLFLPRIVRVGSRLARGRCGRCGYDLHGLRQGVCPECGTATPGVRTIAMRIAGAVWSRRMAVALCFGLIATCASAAAGALLAKGRTATEYAIREREETAFAQGRLLSGPGWVRLAWQGMEPWEVQDSAKVLASREAPGWSTIWDLRMRSRSRDFELGLDRWVAEIACGWPRPAFRAWSPPQERGTPRVIRGGVWFGSSALRTIDVWSPERWPLIVPLAPVWSGLVVDVALFGGAWWAGTAALSAGRRRRRRQRGLCGGCGYDLRGSKNGVCPECGMKEAREE